MWIPLYIGAFLTGWGSFYTAPGALDRPSASRSKISAKGALPWPSIVNLACLGTPFALVASLVPPVVLASRQFGSAFDDYERWTKSVSDVLAQTLPTTSVPSAAVDSLTTQARDVWQSCSKSYWYIDVGFTLWSFWALLFLFFYIPAGGTLVYLLLRQVLHHKAALKSHQRKLKEQMEKEAQVVPTPTLSKLEGQQRGNSRSLANRPQSADSVTTGKTVDSGKASREVVGLTAALQQFVPDSFQVATEGNRLSDGHPDTVRELSDVAMGEPVSTERPISVLKRLIRKDSSTGQKGATARKSKDSKQRNTGSAASARYQYLRRCLVNLLILYLGIIVAACLFLVCTLRLAINEYEASLQSPEVLAEGLYVAGNLAAWVSAVFGCLTIGSIIFRNFDQSAPENEATTAPPPRPAHPQRAIDPESMDQSPGGAIPMALPLSAGQMQSLRGLPAVPESVGMETSMMSFQRSRQETQGGTRFLQATSTDRLGPFVLQTGDHSTSLLSGVYAGTEATLDVCSPVENHKVQFDRSKPKSFTPFRSAMDREPTTSLPQDETESYGIISMLPREELTEPHALAHTSQTHDSTLVPTVDETLVRDAPTNEAAITEYSPRGKTRSSRQSDKRPDTPASIIAREWALSQGSGASSPSTPTIAAYEYGSPGDVSTSASQSRFSSGTPF